MHVVKNNRDEITARSRDRGPLGRRGDLAEDRDPGGAGLQFIRLNGTLVGALAGLTIYVQSRFPGVSPRTPGCPRAG